MEVTKEGRRERKQKRKRKREREPRRERQHEVPLAQLTLMFCFRRGEEEMVYGRCCGRY